MPARRWGAALVLTLSLGASLLPATPASAEGAPSPAPTITAPAEGATVSGTVQVSATASGTYAYVRYAGPSVGGTFSSEPRDGQAMVSWSSAQVPDGDYALRLLDCNDSGCAESEPVTVTVDNPDVVLTEPSESTPVSGRVTVRAEGPEGGLTFLAGDFRHIDPAPPYEATFDLSSHESPFTVSAIACNGAQYSDDCTGNRAERAIDLRRLHLSVAYPVAPFSPNGDGRRDTVTFSLTTQEASDVTMEVLSQSGVEVSEPISVGALPVGTTSWAWDGRTAAGAYLTTGIYHLVFRSAAEIDGLTVHGKAATHIEVDTTPTSLSHRVGLGKTFYPYSDGYLDRVLLGARALESGRIVYSVRNSAGAVVWSPPAFTGSAVDRWWDGRRADGTLLPAGVYTFTMTHEDLAGNQISTTFSFTLSLKKLVTKTAAIVVRGEDAVLLGGDLPCSDRYTFRSRYVIGARIMNGCAPVTAEPTFAGYEMKLPKALRYMSVTLKGFGRSRTTTPVAAVAWHPGDRRYANAQYSTVRPTEALVKHGVYGRQFVDRDGWFVALLVIGPTRDRLSDYDIRNVRADVVYQVLV